LGNKTEDCPSLVAKNRALVEKFLRVPVVFAELEHKDRVAYVGSSSQFVPVADALFTDKKEIALAVTHADCQAVSFYDPKAKVGAIAHVGWRGNVQNSLQVLIKELVFQGGCKKEHLICSISPSLGPAHSEFLSYKQEFPETMWKYADLRSCINLWQLTIDQLQEAGILLENIEVAKIDTYASPEFFSYRRDKETGRNATVLLLL